MAASTAAGNKDVSLNFAWIQLGGLRVGKDESAFDTFIGYAGNVIQDTLVPYGGFDTNVVQYYFDAGNGFSAVVSLEEGSGAVDTIDSYVPHVVGGVKWTQGWGAITGVIAYDSNYEEVAGKVRLDVNADAEPVAVRHGRLRHRRQPHRRDLRRSRPAVAASTSSGAATGQSGVVAPTHSTRRPRSTLQVSYDEGENLGVAANIAYDVVPGFTVTAEVDYLNAGKFDDADFSNWTGADNEEQHRRYAPLPALVLRAGSIQVKSSPGASTPGLFLFRDWVKANRRNRGNR